MSTLKIKNIISANILEEIFVEFPTINNTNNYYYSLFSYSEHDYEYVVSEKYVDEDISLLLTHEFNRLMKLQENLLEEFNNKEESPKTLVEFIIELLSEKDLTLNDVKAFYIGQDENLLVGERNIGVFLQVLDEVELDENELDVLLCLKNGDRIKF